MSEPAEASLGRAMSAVEREHLNRAFLDINAFNYSNQPVFDRDYFKRHYPGFNDHIIDVLLLYESGVRAKEHKQLLKKMKGKTPRPALLEIRRFKTGYSPFADGETGSTGIY